MLRADARGYMRSPLRGWNAEPSGPSRPGTPTPYGFAKSHLQLTADSIDWHPFLTTHDRLCN